MISGDLELFSAAQQSGGMYLPDWRFSITDDKDEKSNATLEPGNAVLNRATTVDN